MDYTLADGFFTHTGTGQRMHKEVQAVPTAWSDKDANSLLWNLMEVVKAGGLAGVQFDPDVPSTYNVLLRAIQNINKAINADLPGAVRIFLQPNPPPGWMRINGGLLSRTVFADLWAHVQTVGAVTEAEWAAGRSGWFSAGDGSTTFRIPDIRGEFIKALDDGRGVDVGRLIGSWLDGSNAAHVHPTTETGHVHPTNDPGHGHFASSGPAGAHNHSDQKIPTDVNDTDLGVGAASNFSLDTPRQIPMAPDHVHPVTVNVSATNLTVQAALTGLVINSQGSVAQPRHVAWPFYLKY